MSKMEIARCSRDDFQQILENLSAFWGSDRSASAHHPLFIEEFPETAFVLRDGNYVCAYLFGFFSGSLDRFYIHLVAVRDTHRSQGLAASLYDHVEDLCRERGVKKMKAITPPFNKESHDFHKARGFELCGGADDNGVPYEPNYGGSGRAMTVMSKQLEVIATMDT